MHLPTIVPRSFKNDTLPAPSRSSGLFESHNHFSPSVSALPLPRNGYSRTRRHVRRPSNQSRTDRRRRRLLGRRSHRLYWMTDGINVLLLFNLVFQRYANGFRLTDKRRSAGWRAGGSRRAHRALIWRKCDHRDTHIIIMSLSSSSSWYTTKCRYTLYRAEFYSY